MMDTSAERITNNTARSPHVLLVEDEPGLASGLKMILSKEGYAVDVTTTGLKALEAFRGNGFELIVVDLRLPDMDGMDVVKLIKQERPETKVIIITGYPSVSSAVESAKLGVSDYLRKPFTDDEFMVAVREAIEEREMDDRERFLKETNEGRLIQKRDVIRVLDRTYEDQAFCRDLMEKGSEVLEDYQISNDARTAIVTGDLKWINENVGELTQKQLNFVLKDLGREA